MLKKEELDKFKPWLISVGLTGSSCLPWIDNPHDTDYVFYVVDNHKGKQNCELLKDKPSNECWLIDELGNQSLRPYAYQYHFLKPLYGSEFPEVDVLKDIPKYKEVLVDFAGCNFVTTSKQWYHILTGIYLIQNDKYELTEEQIRNVHACHDRKMTPEIYQYIQEKIAEFKNELKQE